MVTATARNGVTLSANSRTNGFPPAGVAVIFKLATHEGDFAECDLGRKRRAERRARIADKRAFLRD